MTRGAPSSPPRGGGWPVGRDHGGMTWVVMVACGSVLVGAGFWAGRVVMLPPQAQSSAAQPVTYQVVEQTVGRSLNFTAQAEWELTPLTRAGLSGIVTSVEFEPGATVDVGDVLYTVNMRPVVVAVGTVPSYRDLKSGDTGSDVEQFQRVLKSIGYLDPDPSGTFDAQTISATRAWQKAVGVQADGIVQLGDVAFVPKLPVRVVATDALMVGGILGGGEVVVNSLAAAPRIVVALTPEQSDLVPVSAPVIVTHPNGTWSGVVAKAAEPVGAAGITLELSLAAADGGPICGDECLTRIPPFGVTYFDVELVVVPAVTGPVVPTAAIATDPGGHQTVELVNGAQVPISVRQSAGGLAVVSGIDPGTVIVLPFAASAGE